MKRKRKHEEKKKHDIVFVKDFFLTPSELHNYITAYN